MNEKLSLENFHQQFVTFLDKFSIMYLNLWIPDNYLKNLLNTEIEVMKL